MLHSRTLFKEVIVKMSESTSAVSRRCKFRCMQHNLAMWHIPEARKQDRRQKKFKKYFITSKKVEVKRTQLNPAIEKGCSSVACNQ